MATIRAQIGALLQGDEEDVNESNLFGGLRGWRMSWVSPRGPVEPTTCGPERALVLSQDPAGYISPPRHGDTFSALSKGCLVSLS